MSTYARTQGRWRWAVVIALIASLLAAPFLSHSSIASPADHVGVEAVLDTAPPNSGSNVDGHGDDCAACAFHKMLFSGSCVVGPGATVAARAETLCAPILLTIKTKLFRPPIA